MAKHVIKITETLEKAVIVSANDGEEALVKVRDAYKNEKIVLSADNAAVKTDFDLITHVLRTYGITDKELIETEGI